MWKKLKILFAPTDMTEGTPWKKIVAFMIPMLLGNIAQQLYNTVDSIVVGQYVGDNALAAVGSAGPILNLLLVKNFLPELYEEIREKQSFEEFEKVYND